MFLGRSLLLFGSGLNRDATLINSIIEEKQKIWFVKKLAFIINLLQFRKSQFYLHDNFFHKGILYIFIFSTNCFIILNIFYCLELFHCNSPHFFLWVTIFITILKNKNILQPFFNLKKCYFTDLLVLSSFYCLVEDFSLIIIISYLGSYCNISGLILYIR